MMPMARRIAGSIIVVAAVAAAAAPIPATWIEQYFSRAWFPPVQRVLTAFSNACPFALMDVALATVSVLVLAGLLSIARAPRGRRLAMLARRAGQAAVLAAVGYLAFAAAWGWNYRRQPLTALLDFDDARVTRESVVALNDAAIAEASRLRPRLPPGTAGWADSAGVAADLEPVLDTGTRFLGLPGPVRAGRPKWTILDPYLTRAGVSGVTDPVFLETLVASNLLPFELPAVIAHEWGHLAGLARESDASFFGLLVCLHGSDAAQYSAWLDIFVRTFGARDEEGRRAALARLPDEVRADLRAMAERSKRDRVQAVSLLAWRTYDTYLRSQRVDSGVRNYGEVVRLVAGTRFEPGWRPALRPAR